MVGGYVSSSLLRKYLIENESQLSRYEIKRASDESYYFVLIANNNEVIAKSQMYKSKQSAIKGITSVKKHADSRIVDLT